MLLKCTTGNLFYLGKKEIEMKDRASKSGKAD